MSNSANPSKFVFRPHGKFKIWTEGALLLTEVVGPWNRELVLQWQKQALVVAKELGQRMPYVGITIVRESILCPADAMEAIGQATSYALARLHCLANVIVAEPDVVGRDVVQFAYEKIEVNHYFDDVEVAKKWALALLAEQANRANKPTIPPI